MKRIDKKNAVKGLLAFMVVWVVGGALLHVAWHGFATLGDLVAFLLGRFITGAIGGLLAWILLPDRF